VKWLVVVVVVYTAIAMLRSAARNVGNVNNVNNVDRPAPNG